MTINKFLATVGGAAIALTLATGSAQAMFLSGHFDVTGAGPSAFRVGGPFGAQTTVLLADYLDFGANNLVPTQLVRPGSILSSDGTGSFVSLQINPNFSFGTIWDMSLAAPPVGGVVTPAAQPMLSITAGNAPFLTYTFTSTLLNVIQRTALATGDTLIINGTGILDDGAGGADPTPGVFTLSTSTTPGGGTTFSYSSSAATIPEPATLGLLGVGLLAAGAATRRRRKAAA